MITHSSILENCMDYIVHGVAKSQTRLSNYHLGKYKSTCFSTKTRNQLSSPEDMVCPGFSSCCFTEIDVPIDLRWVSQGISGLL